jgi:hypothetical protein
MATQTELSEMVIRVWVTSMWFASVLTHMTALAPCPEAISFGQIVSMTPKGSWAFAPP